MSFETDSRRGQFSLPRATPAVALILLTLWTCRAGADVNIESRAAADASARERAKVHPLVPALRHAESALQAVAALEGYTATFMKQDIVDGRVHAHTMFLKFRREPFSVYLKFKEPHVGREVIYVEGQNDGKLLAHETGFAALVGTVALLPTSSQAMSESKHPITEIGMEKLVKGVIEQWKREMKYGETEVKYFPEATHDKLGGGKDRCLVIQVKHPRPRKQFPFHITRLWIDRKTGLPVRVAHFGFPDGRRENPPLLEEYTYTNVATDVRLRDIDFDIRNPAYGF